MTDTCSTLASRFCKVSEPISFSGWFIWLVILLQSTSGAEPCDNECPTDSGDMFLFPYPDGSRIVSWSTAHDLCRQHNMTLPTIRSPCEQYMFSSYLQSVGAYEYDIWLGGRTEANHEWKWLNGSQPTNTSFDKQTTGKGFAYIWMSPYVMLGNATSEVERKFICEFYDEEICQEAKSHNLRYYMTFQSSGNKSIKCYIPSKHGSNWYNARSYCRRLGGDLATSSDVVDSYSRFNSTGNETFWVGLRQVKWRWENDEDVDMTFFRSVNVDRAVNDSTCMCAVRAEQWNWDSRPCNDTDKNSLTVVCQKVFTIKPPLPIPPGCSDGSLSWKIGTCTLIVITLLLLITVFVLIVILRRLSKTDHPEGDNKIARPQDVLRLRYAVETQSTSTLLTTQLVEKSDEAKENRKKRPAVTPSKPGGAYANNVPHIPYAGHSTIPDPVARYDIAIHRIHEYTRQISAVSSLSYENATSEHPVLTDLYKKTDSRPVKPKRKPEPKKAEEHCKDQAQPYSNVTVCDVERPVSPSLHTTNSDATCKASIPPTTQPTTRKGNKGRVLNDDACLTVQETYSTLEIKSGQAVRYANEDCHNTYQKMKYATDPDGYLQPKDLEQISESSTRTGHSFVTSGYANADGKEPSSQHYANEGGKSIAKKVSKLTARLGRKLQNKSRTTAPVSPSEFVSAFIKHSVARSVSLDRNHSNNRASKASTHTYAEILLDDNVFESTNQLTDAQPTERTKKERTVLHKKLSAKNWSENEGAVGY